MVDNYGGFQNKKMPCGLHPCALSLSKELEEEICRWIRLKSEKGEDVTRFSVRKKAKKLFGSEEFQATKGWLRRFVDRHPGIKDYFVHERSKGAAENIMESGT